jgi:hypothetical protein
VIIDFIDLMLCFICDLLVLNYFDFMLFRYNCVYWYGQSLEFNMKGNIFNGVSGMYTSMMKKNNR